MWRALFLALGITAIVIGVESMLIESATLYRGGSLSAFVNPSSSPAGGTQVWTPSEFFPWAVLSGGALVMIYAFTLPRHWQGGGE